MGNQFCNLASCDEDAQGRCVTGGSNRNDCNRSLSKVCGCDQRTYDNECLAKNYGVSVDYNGSCGDGRNQSQLGSRCVKNSNCAKNYYWFCTRIPANKDDCKSVPNDSVCTCDGKTEKNECRAEYMSKGVRSYGSC